MKKLGLLTAIVALGMLFSTVPAHAFTLGGTSGYLKIKLANVEMAVDPSVACPGFAVAACTSMADGIEDSWGIAKITDIYDQTDPTSTPIWSSGDDTGMGPEELTIMYYGFDYNTVASNGMGGINISTVGGGFSLYADTAMDYSIAAGPGGRIDATHYTGATNGTLLLSGLFDAGISLVDPLSTFDINQDGTTFPSTGDSTGYASVVPGVGTMWAAFDGNAYNGGMSDFFVLMNTRLHPDKYMTDYGWDLNSEDPILATIPEPSTFILLGGGLIGAAFAARRKRKKA